MTILPKELEETNYKFIKELEEKILDETTRNKIIFLSTLIGSYEARINYETKTKPPRPIQDFEAERITTKIFEAKYIAHVMEDMLKLFEKITPDKILEKLYTIKSTIEDKNIPKAGLYGLFKYFNSDNDIEKIGERFSRKLKENGKYFIEKIENNMLEKNGLKERILLAEESELSNVLVSEIKYREG